jgi:hypothetical protein
VVKLGLEVALRALDVAMRLGAAALGNVGLAGGFAGELGLELDNLRVELVDSLELAADVAVEVDDVAGDHRCTGDRVRFQERSSSIGD